MQCRGSRRAFTTAGEKSGLMPGYGMKRGAPGQFFYLVAHALRRSQFSLSSDGIAYFLLHLFQLMGQDFHVAADLLVGYPGIYLGGFQIRMPQKTAYGLDGYTVREQHGGGVRMPGPHDRSTVYLKPHCLPSSFIWCCICRCSLPEYMIVLGQPLILLYDALGHVQQADVGLGVCLAYGG